MSRPCPHCGGTGIVHGPVPVEVGGMDLRDAILRTARLACRHDLAAGTMPTVLFVRPEACNALDESIAAVRREQRSFWRSLPGKPWPMRACRPALRARPRMDRARPLRLPPCFRRVRRWRARWVGMGD